MTLLTIDKLSLNIREAPILRDVSLTIAPGEIVALTGESGSGKSMTALSVMGLLPKGAVTSGTVHLGETEILAASERTLCALRGNRVGIIFQEPMTALNPLRTIGDQVAETILIHTDTGRLGAMDRAADVLGRVGLDPARIPASRYPHELSGGQRQRVVIAMAIALRPDLLIADEPTTALDVMTQARIVELIIRLVREDGMGCMMITHDLAVVANMADRIAVMRQGEIVETGPTPDLLRHRTHPYTRALFAASAHRVDLPAPRGTATILDVRDAVRDYPLPRKGLFAKRRHMRAVDGVSLSLRSGERLALVGESGCGKSTLTRAILGLEPLQGGEIRFRGQPVGPDMEPALRTGLQVVFQDPYGSFNPRWRVERLVAEPFHLMSEQPAPAERRERIAETLSDVGLSGDVMDRYIHEFSGGQRQRIAIARALITRPEVIVLDEAVSALDVSIRAQILDLLANLSARYGLAYLFISHDLGVVRTISDRVLVMKAGKIVEEGPTRAVFEAPRHAYTRMLIAASPRLDAFETA
ncbi:MAG: dipeptide ABC transporter ATP-binding protein [Pseudomonadota bacterium]